MYVSNMETQISYALTRNRLCDNRPLPLFIPTEFLTTGTALADLITAYNKKHLLCFETLIRDLLNSPVAMVPQQASSIHKELVRIPQSLIKRLPIPLDSIVLRICANAKTVAEKN